MQYRTVPKTGDKLSVLGYGCMRFPQKMRAINEKLAEAQMLRAMDQGVNYYDTAWPYHGGKASLSWERCSRGTAAGTGSNWPPNCPIGWPDQKPI